MGKVVLGGSSGSWKSQCQGMWSFDYIVSTCHVALVSGSQVSLGCPVHVVVSWQC